MIIAKISSVSVATGHRIVQTLSCLLVDLRGHLTDGKVQFLSTASCHWLVGYSLIKKLRCERKSIANCDDCNHVT